MGKINISDKIVFENQKKKRKCGNERNVYINHISKTSFRHRIRSLLGRAAAK